MPITTLQHEEKNKMIMVTCSIRPVTEIFKCILQCISMLADLLQISMCLFLGLKS
jgi:hypothetical protein